MTIETLKPQYLTVGPGRRMVVLEEAVFAELLREADLSMPELPPADEDGNFPALETLDAMQAREIISRRRRAGLSQAELARRAGIRPETLNRIEQSRNSPNVATIAKIDRALREAEASQTGKRASRVTK